MGWRDGRRHRLSVARRGDSRLVGNLCWRLPKQRRDAKRQHYCHNVRTSRWFWVYAGNRRRERGVTMRGLLRTGCAALFLALPSIGHAQNFTGQQYTPLGYCQLTSITAATGLSSCSGGIPSGATWVELCITGAGASYRDDGTAPTASIGMLVASGVCFPYSVRPLSAIQFIQQTSGTVIGASFYK